MATLSKGALVFIKDNVNEMMEYMKTLRDWYSQFDCDNINAFNELDTQSKLDVIKSGLCNEFADWTWVFCYEDDVKVCELLIEKMNIDIKKVVDRILEDQELEFPKWKFDLLKPTDQDIDYTKKEITKQIELNKTKNRKRQSHVPQGLKDKFGIDQP